MGYRLIISTSLSHLHVIVVKTQLNLAEYTVIYDGKLRVQRASFVEGIITKTASDQQKTFEQDILGMDIDDLENMVSFSFHK